MYATFQRYHWSVSQMIRAAAAACGATLFASWVGLLALEAYRGGGIPNIRSANQALILFVVFAAYVIGWRHAFWGGAMAVLGTAALFAVSYLAVGMWPPFPATILAAPGVLYVVASLIADHEHHSEPQTRPT